MVKKMEAKYLGQGTVELTIFYVIEKNWKVHTYYVNIVLQILAGIYVFSNCFTKWNRLQSHYTNAAQEVQWGKKGVRSLLGFNLRK